MIGSEAERLQYLDNEYPIWEKQTLWMFFRRAVEKQPEAPCLFHQERPYSYRQFYQLAARISRSLYAAGVRPGDHVAVSLRNGAFCCGMIFALARLNAVRIPLNMQMTVEGKTFCMRQARADWLVGTELSALMSDALPVRKGCIATEDEQAFLCRGDAIPDALLSAIEEQKRDPDAVYDIMFTSGSTAFPKGVQLTHDALLRTSYGTCRTRRMEPGRRILVPVPFYHIFAFTQGLLAAMFVGGSIILSDRRYSAENCLYLLRRHSASDLISVPMIAIGLMDCVQKEAGCVPAEKPVPSLHSAFISPSGPVWMWQRFKDVFQIADITTGYGMTECGGTTTISSPLDPTEMLIHSVGRLKDGGSAGLSAANPHLLDIKICDVESGAPLPCGASGEILCRGVTVTPGYYNNPEANQNAFEADGWFHTGDLGHLDSDGNLVFDGRKGDTFKVNGENVSPQNVELAISRCPGVLHVDVVGVPHETFGEVGAAFLDAGPLNDDPVEQERIRNWCESNLPACQRPAYYFFEDQSLWPRSATNKVQKRKMRERAMSMLREEQT